MGTFKSLALAAAVLLTSSMAMADTIDPIVSPSRGPTGSPPLTSTETIPIVCGETDTTCGTVTEDFTVTGGVVTAVDITLPPADTALGVTCGASNAFLFTGKTVNEDGSTTCSYAAFTGVNTDPTDLTESISQLEADCLASNQGEDQQDPDDCIGIPAGTDQSDLIFSITGAANGSSITANSVITPEPGSLALLLIGLGSLGAFTIRRRQLAQ